MVTHQLTDDGLTVPCDTFEHSLVPPAPEAGALPHSRKEIP